MGSNKSQEMRFISILALAASTALAEQDLILGLGEDDDNEDSRDQGKL